MLKSKAIADFVPAKLADLRPGVPLPADLHLYFKSNSHIMVWQKAGSILSAEQIERYKARGLDSLWVHQSEWQSFQNYLHPVLEAPQPTELVSISAMEIEPPTETKISSTAEAPTEDSSVSSEIPVAEELVYVPKVNAQKLLDIIRDDAKNEREKCALVAKAARELLGELASPIHVEAQIPVSRAIARIVRDFLSETTREARTLANQVWAISSLEPELSHGVNVSTLAVLFSLAFGKTDEGLLSDVGMAAFLHDIGICEIPFALAQTPLEALTPEQRQTYLSHTTAGTALVSTYAPELPPRVRFLMESHHGKYSDAKVLTPSTEISQFLAIADVIDSMCNGLWDGAQRTVLESLLTLEALEAEAGPSKQFTPEIFSAILRWIRSRLSEHSLENASLAVDEHLRGNRARSA